MWTVPWYFCHLFNPVPKQQINCKDVYCHLWFWYPRLKLNSQRPPWNIKSSISVYLTQLRRHTKPNFQDKPVEAFLAFSIKHSPHSFSYTLFHFFLAFQSLPGYLILGKVSQWWGGSIFLTFPKHKFKDLLAVVYLWSNFSHRTCLGTTNLSYSIT